MQVQVNVNIDANGLTDEALKAITEYATLEAREAFYAAVDEAERKLPTHLMLADTVDTEKLQLEYDPRERMTA